MDTVQKRERKNEQNRPTLKRLFTVYYYYCQPTAIDHFLRETVALSERPFPSIPSKENDETKETERICMSGFAQSTTVL
jgi:hypothetical protein